MSSTTPILDAAYEDGNEGDLEHDSADSSGDSESDSESESSDASVESVDGPTPPKRRKYSSDEIRTKLENRETGYSAKPYTEQHSQWESKLWDMCNKVYDDKGSIIEFVQCRKCSRVFSFKGNSKSGSSHITRHPCKRRAGPGRGQQTLNRFVQKKVPPQAKAKVIEGCVAFCAKDLRPFHIVCGKGFMFLANRLMQVGAAHPMAKAEDVIPCRTTVARHTTDTATDPRMAVIPELADAFKAGCACTLDLWKEKYSRVSYLCLTVHYITDSWELHERVLATKDCDPHATKSGEIIQAMLVQIFSLYDADRTVLKKLVFVGDRGSNIVKALKGYHKINCAAHLIHNVITYTFHRDRELPEEYYECIEACKALVVYFKRTGLLHRLPKSLKQECDTRWNSLLTLLFSIYEHLDAIDLIVLNANELDRAVLINRDILRELIDFLLRFKHLSDQFETSKTPTLHIILPGFHALKDHCLEKDSDSVNIAAVKAVASAKVYLLMVPTDMHRMATALNPKMKHLKFLPEAERTQTYGRLRELVAQVPAIANPVHGGQQRPPTDPQPVVAGRLEQYEDSNLDEEESVEKDEVEIYLKTKMKKNVPILSFWKAHEKDLPRLAKVAKKILSIPGSSAASERNFSVAGATVEKRRTRLSPSSLNDLLFLNSNMEL